MATYGARKEADKFTWPACGQKFAVATRAALLGIALSAWVFAAGCIGLTGNPNAKGTSATSGSGSSSSSGSGTSTGGSQPSAPSQPTEPVQPSQLSPSSAQVNFGNVTVGSSTSQLVTLTVAGTQDVNISTVTASGAGFSVSGGSNTTLTPSQSITVSVAFQPTAGGTATGTLTIASNASNSSLSITLSGNGIVATHTVALSWQPSASPVIGYFVFRGSSVSSLTQLNVNEVATTSYTDTNVAGGQTYVYAVKSINASSVLSGFSNMVTVRVPAQ